MSEHENRDLHDGRYRDWFTDVVARAHVKIDLWADYIEGFSITRFPAPGRTLILYGSGPRPFDIRDCESLMRLPGWPQQQLYPDDHFQPWWEIVLTNYDAFNAGDSPVRCHMWWADPQNCDDHEHRVFNLASAAARLYGIRQRMES